MKAFLFTAAVVWISLCMINPAPAHAQNISYSVGGGVTISNTGKTTTVTQTKTEGSKTTTTSTSTTGGTKAGTGTTTTTVKTPTSTTTTTTKTTGSTSAPCGGDCGGGSGDGSGDNHNTTAKKTASTPTAGTIPVYVGGGVTVNQAPPGSPASAVNKTPTTITQVKNGQTITTVTTAGKPVGNSTTTVVTNAPCGGDCGSGGSGSGHTITDPEILQQYKDYAAGRIAQDKIDKAKGYDPNNYLSPGVAADYYIHRRFMYTKTGDPNNPFAAGPAEMFARQANPNIQPDDPALLAAKALDDLIYKNRLDDDHHGAFSVSVPHTDAGYWSIAKFGQEMTSVQRLGVENSILVAGDRDQVEQAERLYNQILKGNSKSGLADDPNTGGLTYPDAGGGLSQLAPGGIIFADAGQDWTRFTDDPQNTPNDTFSEIFRHEIEHAGINAMSQAAREGLAVDAQTGRLAESIVAGMRLNNVVPSKAPGSFQSQIDVIDKDNVDNIILLQQSRNVADPDDPRNYVNSVNEVLAFINAGDINRGVLAASFADAYGLDKKGGEDMVNQIANMDSFRKLNDQLNSNADYVANSLQQKRNTAAQSGSK